MATVRLEAALDILRRHEETLRLRGVRHAAVFGSVARGEEQAGSDLDILVELDPGQPIGIFEYSRLLLYIQEILGERSDVANRRRLKPLLRDAVLRDAVHAF